MNTKNYIKQLSAILRSPRDLKEMESFLDDFFSPAEVKQLVERWLIGDLLIRDHSQREVKEKLKVSISKVSRVAAMVQYGTGSFRKVWQRVNN